jgi:predicted PurR-regulated permease PerM
MTVQRILVFWITALFVFVFLLWLSSDILLPFAGGIVLAYLQAPLADRLERLGMNRTLAALLIVSAVVVTLVLMTLLVLPILSGQALALMASIPSYARRLQALLADLGPPWLKQMFSGDASKTPPELVSRGVGYLNGLLGSLWSGGKAVISFISVIVIMPVISFYLICDWHKMIGTLNSWVPLKCRQTVHQIVGEIDAAISGFMRGQTGICLIISLYYAVTLSSVGLNFALLIGLANGVLSFIPFVGSIMGLAIGVGVAVEQFWPTGLRSRWWLLSFWPASSSRVTC